MSTARNEPEAWIIWDTSNEDINPPPVIVSFGEDPPSWPGYSCSDEEDDDVLGYYSWSTMPGFDGYARFIINDANGCWYLFHETSQSPWGPDEGDPDDPWDDDFNAEDKCIAACRWPGAEKRDVAVFIFSRVAKLIMRGDTRVPGNGLDYFCYEAEVCEEGWAIAEEELEAEEAIESGPVSWVVWDVHSRSDGPPPVIASHGNNLPPLFECVIDQEEEDDLYLGSYEWSTMPGFDGNGKFSMQLRGGCWYLWHREIVFEPAERNEEAEGDDLGGDLEPVVTREDCVAACRWPESPKETVAKLIFSKVAKLMIAGDHRVPGSSMDFFCDDAELCREAWELAKVELEWERANPAGQES